MTARPPQGAHYAGLLTQIRLFKRHRVYRDVPAAHNDNAEWVA